MIEARNPLIVIAVISAAFYLLVAGFALVKHTFRERVERWLVLYLLVSGFWHLSQAMQSLSRYSPGEETAFERISLYGILILALLFCFLSRSFLQLKQDRTWWVFGLLWIGALAFVDLDVLTLPDVWWRGWGITFGSRDLFTGISLVGWLLVMGATAAFTWTAYSQTARQPLHRNRIRYWILAWTSTVVGDLVYITGHQVLAGLFLLLTTLLISYTALSYRLLDIRQVARRAISLLTVTLVIEALYIVGLLAMSKEPPTIFANFALAEGPFVLALLIILVDPLLKLVQGLLERFAPEIEYDSNLTLREYSLNISNIVHLGELEATVVRLISQAMEIRYGTLFLVDKIAGQDEQPVYQVSSVQGFGDEKLVLGSFDSGSVVANYLALERRPLVQYDIDLQPRFKQTSESEREWLAGLGMEVFVPVYAKGNWIGLLGLGPKVSGDRYFDNDLILLRTLADQTAIALENARLVTDLVRLNRELKQAYTDLEEANRHLQESDELKSAFISVITHELRTPIANSTFSLQLLERHGLEVLNEAQREELTQLASHIGDARVMIDNLITFAHFVRQRGAMRLAELDFFELVRDAMIPLKPLALSKDISLEVSLPSHKMRLRSDRDRMLDAVHHLVHNAIKFTDPGGRIRVRSWEEAGSVFFEVQDTGLGVPEDKLSTIWEDFVQMADPLRRGAEGLGLGLSLVNYVVDAHGGEVFVISREHVGSTFGFEIPLNGGAPSNCHTPELLAEANLLDRIEF